MRHSPPFPTLLLVSELLAACALFGAGLPAARADLEVVTLHPMMTDLAKRVGGTHVSVTPLLPAGADIHDFSPSSGDMAKARSADVVLASGKGLELYLPRLKSSLPDNVRVVEAGNAVPSIRLSAKDAVFACCPQHAVGSIDPHWWHSISGMRKAASYVAKEFAKSDPANKAAYQANAAAWGRELDALDSWAKREISRIPRPSRYLVTAHAAFGYFCKDFGFKSIPVAGPSAENANSQYLAEVIAQIRTNRVRTVFPERNANPRALDSVAATSGARKGSPLIADASAPGVTTYEAFVRHNISAIVSGLRAP